VLSVPLDEPRLLCAMDHNMWDMFRESTRLARGGELVETARYWMGYSPRGAEFHNMVMVKAPVTAEEILEAAERFYGPRQKRFSICVREHADEELGQALQTRGFTVYTAMPGMVLFDHLRPMPPPTGLDIRPVIDDRARCEFLEVVAEAYSVYGAPREFAEDAFAAMESVCAPHIQAYVAYLRSEPVAAASLYLSHGAAGVGWVATLSEHRRQGYGEAVTAAVVREGFRRGAGFANLQASPMGESLYERMGFSTRTDYQVLIPPATKV
jgi:GNAT superfamily N-acetyltransferase